MFGLFSKKPEKNPEEQILDCRQKRDWTGLVKAYYNLGCSCMEQGDFNHAVLWLHRADSIYSARDDIYEAVGEALIDDCSNRIGQLEEAPVLYNTILSQIEETAEEMEDIQVRLWGLFALARLANLGSQLQFLPGCAVLGKLNRVVDLVLQSFRSPIDASEFGELQEMSSQLYELSDSEDFWGCSAEIPVFGMAPFQVFDLNSMGMLLEIDAYLDNHLTALTQTEESPEECSPETGLISCGLLIDYYVRTVEGKLEDVAQIKAELARIQDDLTFLRSVPSWEQVIQRTKEYQSLDILKA